MGSQAPLRPGSVLPKHIHGYGRLTRSGGTVSVQQGSSSTQREIIRCFVVAAGGSIILTGNQSIDGVAVPEGSTVLVIGRATQSENGVYRTGAGGWTRMYSADQIIQWLVHVTNGATYAGAWFGTTDGTSFTLLVDEDDLAAHASTTATGEALGHVRADGSTITVDGSGVISTVDGANWQNVRIAASGTEIGPVPMINFDTGLGTYIQVLDEVTAHGFMTIRVHSTGVLGSGTAGKVPLWSYDATLGDSRIETGTLSGSIKIPWLAGDSVPTLYVGSDSSANLRSAVVGYSGSGVALYGEVNYGGAGVKGFCGVNNTTGWLGHTSSGVRGEASGSYYGVHGINQTGTAIVGETTSGYGVFGSASGAGAGVRAFSSASGPAIDAVASFTGIAVKANSARAQAGYFSNNNASNTSPTLQVDNNSGSAEAFYAYQGGSGRGATIQILNVSNTSPALIVSTNGSGRGLEVTTSSGFGLYVSSGSGGAGVYCVMNAGGSAFYGYRDVASSTLAVMTAEQVNASCSSPALTARTLGTGPALKGEGQLDLPYRSTTASVTLTERDVWVGVGTLTAGITITLPSAATCARRFIIIVDEAGSVNGTRPITVARSGTDTINGGTSATIAVARGSLRLYSNGSNWFTF